jgi:hypothetical protein
LNDNREAVRQGTRVKDDAGLMAARPNTPLLAKRPVAAKNYSWVFSVGKLLHRTNSDWLNAPQFSSLAVA